MMLYQLLGLLPLAVIAFVVFGFIRVTSGKNSQKPSAPVAGIAVAEQALPKQEILPKSTFREPRDRKVVSVDLRDGKATVVAHERPRYHKSQALLIVWTGKRVQGKKVLNAAKGRRGVRRNLRIEEAVYDLGFVDRPELDGLAVEEFLERGRKKLAELVAKGEISQRKVPVQEVPAAEITQPATATAVVEIQPPKPEPPLVLRKVGSVFRGKVLQIGLLPGNDNQPYYGMRYQKLDGTEDVVFGKYLRTAFQEAGAGVGDFVEVIKTGRKATTPGKTPMTMFQVAKLSPDQVAQLQ